MIVVLIMLVVIGLTSAAAMRNATSSERAVNNLRTLNLAQQYAEAGLRYCETEINKATPVTTIASLQKANITTYSPEAWTVAATWNSGGSRTVVASSYVASVDSSFQPAFLPQCFAEKRLLPDGNEVIVVTSRGFSSDFEWESAADTKTKRGSVVWLQSFIAF